MFGSRSQSILRVCLALMVSVGSWAHANGPLESASPRFRVRHWTSDDGLPQNRIACLLQTHDGYLWIGTWFGLARFDGLHFTVFNQQNTSALTNQTINALAEDRDGTLWIGTDDGLVSYRNHQFHRFTTADGLPRRPVWRLASARSGGVWVQSEGFVALFKDGEFSHWWLAHLVPNDQIISLSESASGWVNVVTRQGWLQISPDGAEMRTNEFHSDLARGWHTSAIAAKPDGVWAASDTGLKLLQRDSAPISVPQFAGQRIGLVFHGRLGDTWAGIEPGKLYHLEDGAWRLYNLGAEMLPTIVCLAEDQDGDLWVGTDGGLVLLQRQYARTYATHAGAARDNIWSVCEGTDGSIWAGSDHGLWCIRNGRPTIPKAQEPYPGNRDLSVSPGPDGVVWIDKEGIGLLEYDGRRFVQRIHGWKLAGVHPLYRDQAGRLWVGGRNGAVAYDQGRFGTPVISLTNEALSGISCVFEASDKTYWFGRWGHGVRHVHGGKISSYTTQDGLSDNTVTTICEDDQGSLWFGTEKGLTRWHNGGVFAFRQQSGLPQGPINCVLVDDFGNLWFSGLNGIYRATLTALDAVADGRAISLQCLRFNSVDGMQSSESNGDHQPSGWKAHDGRLWFATGRGLVAIDPKKIKAHEDLLTNGPPVVIEQVKANGKVVFGDESSTTQNVGGSNRPKDTVKPLRIAAGHGHVVEFHFAAMDFAAPNQIRFRYRLIGDGGDWSEETGERLVPFTDLQPGSYRFEVTAENHHGIWNPHPATLAFIIEPYFWQTPLFYILCACALIVLVAAIQAYRLKWQRRVLKLEEQRSLANERTRIARDLHDDLGTALTGLALELDVLGHGSSDNKSSRSDVLAQAAQHARNLAERMREVVWAVNPRCDTVPSVATFLEQQAGQLLGAAGISVRLDFPETIPDLPMNSLHRHQLALCVREAFNNIVRHARATVANIRLELTDHKLFIRIQDNGRGFDGKKKSGGEHGLENMQARVAKMGGTVQCESQPGKGTIITFMVPIAPEDNLE